MGSEDKSGKSFRFRENSEGKAYKQNIKRKPGTPVPSQINKTGETSSSPSFFKSLFL
jgi:hypothetical protein